MALSPDRYRDIEATLKEIQEYLTEVAREIDEAALRTNKQGQTYQMAVNAATQLAQLRQALQKEQENQGIRKQNRRPQKR
jgi:Sec-independent protein translocase protein TatA